MKKFSLLLLLFFSTFSFSQKELSQKLGQVTLKELKMRFYEKDSTAKALILKEHGNLYFSPKKHFSNVTDFYYKKKVFDKNITKNSEVNINYFGEEKISNIKGYTYNLNEKGQLVKVEIKKDEIFKKVISGRKKQISFAFPNVQNGSVIEYSYTLTSPYTNLDSWIFQSNIPKLKSDFNGLILGDYKYDISLKGFLSLDRKNNSVKRKCNYNWGKSGDCLVVSYGMDNIPVFKEEGYSTNVYNFKSKIVFKRKLNFNNKYYKDFYTWKSIDKRFKKNISKTFKNGFFKRKLPSEIIKIKDPLLKSKKIFYYIQNHFLSNTTNDRWSQINLSKNYNKKEGNNFTINLVLFNSLRASKIKSQLVLVSSRNYYKPNEDSPDLDDFNYLLVMVSINDFNYFIDASDKNLMFGLTPFHTLNGKVRIMNLEKGSYWKDLKPIYGSAQNINLNLKISNSDVFNGQLSIHSLGYNALLLKVAHKNTNQDKYIEDFEDANSIEIEDYTIKGKESKDKVLKEDFIFTYNNNELSNKDEILFKPFVFKNFNSNPFTLKTRLYPVDFGYKINFTQRLKISFPEGYILNYLPESVILSLPNNGGSFIFNIKKIKSELSIFFKIKLNRTEYTSEDYYALKKFFDKIVKVQSTLIKLEKKI